MAFKQFWIMAYRDLIRNRRRTILTLVAITLGLTLSIFMNGLISGMIDSSLQDNIRLTTGHIQVRTASYEELKTSLLWQDLLDEPDVLAARAEALPEVQTASPILWASGILATARESTGVRVNGIVPGSALHDPIREGMVAGVFLTPASRGEIMIGQQLANQMKVGLGDRISLAVANSDGVPIESTFDIVGLINTGFPGIDSANVFISLDQAQSITNARNRASVVRMVLNDAADTDAVKAALQAPAYTVLDWRELNDVLLNAMETGMAFYNILYGIIFLVVAVIIANTLLMSVFERIREMGILAALGMKGRQIMTMFLLEAVILGVLGSVTGMLLGGGLVLYFAEAGIYIGESSANVVQGMALGTSMYTTLVPANVLTLAIAMLLVIIVVSLYPAWYAARLEPVEALQSL